MTLFYQDDHQVIMIIHLTYLSRYDRGRHKVNALFNKPGPQSKVLCGTVCALSIAIVLYY